MEQALKASAKRWGRRIRIERRKLQTAEVFRELFRYEKHYGSKGDESIKLFVGGRCLAGSKAVAARLNDAVAAELAAGSATFVPPPPGQDGGAGGEGQLFAEILSRFQGFSAGAVAVAGLLDGVNPCAFTTIIFLLSMLAYLGRSRRQLAAVGVGFTADRGRQAGIIARGAGSLSRRVRSPCASGTVRGCRCFPEVPNSSHRMEARVRPARTVSSPPDGRWRFPGSLPFRLGWLSV